MAKGFLFDANIPGKFDNDTKYSREIKIPHYTPSGKKPNIAELYNYSKYSKLIRDINNSTVTEDEKKFLRFAASRHIVYNYAKIADYYANSGAELQKLMEDSGLVIIDINDAIANGFVELSGRLDELIDLHKENKQRGE